MAAENNSLTGGVNGQQPDSAQLGVTCCEKRDFNECYLAIQPIVLDIFQDGGWE